MDGDKRDYIIALDFCAIKIFLLKCSVPIVENWYDGCTK